MKRTAGGTHDAASPAAPTSGPASPTRKVETTAWTPPSPPPRPPLLRVMGNQSGIRARARCGLGFREGLAERGQDPLTAVHDGDADPGCAGFGLSWPGAVVEEFAELVGGLDVCGISVGNDDALGGWQCFPGCGLLPSWESVIPV